MMRTGPVRHVARVGAILGEGPVWVAREQRLWFVDIKGHTLLRFDPATSALDRWVAPGEPGWALPVAGGGMLVGMPGGLHRFDPETGTFDPVAQVETEIPGNRLNDATTDAQGSVLFGTMDNGERLATGRLYRFADGRIADTGLPPVAITNGPALSPDGRTLYHTDTLGRTIHAVVVQDDGTLGPMRVFARIEDVAGYPDGPACDSAGNVWTGLFAGWGVRCHAPDGTVIHTVRLPVANVTKVAFGGPDFRTAYVTTARKGLDATALAEQPEAGDLFAFEVEVPGLPLTEVATLR